MAEPSGTAQGAGVAEIVLDHLARHFDALADVCEQTLGSTRAPAYRHVSATCREVLTDGTGWALDLQHALGRATAFAPALTPPAQGALTGTCERCGSDAAHHAVSPSGECIRRTPADAGGAVDREALDDLLAHCEVRSARTMEPRKSEWLRRAAAVRALAARAREAEGLRAERQAAVRYMSGRGVSPFYPRSDAGEPLVPRNLSGMIVALEDQRAGEARREVVSEAAALRARCERLEQACERLVAAQARAAEPAGEA